MTALSIIDQARAEGLELRSNGDKLKLIGPASVVERWKPRIVANKQEIMGALKSTSTWWKIHFVGRAPVEIWTAPPATRAEVMARRPDAVDAVPINHPAPEQSRCCADCAHVTGRGGCGSPVAAGLSDLDGVIVYHDQAGADCPAWLSTIPEDLEALIQRAATRWQYSTDDLAMIYDLARRDPDGLRVALETDGAFAQ